MSLSHRSGEIVTKDPESGADGVVYTFRRRLTIAEVNAGAELCPALPNHQYQLARVLMIAVGGAVTSNTSIEITGTQGGSPVDLASFAQADLVEDAVLGEADATFLAAGASFVENDEGTSLDIANTGSDITVATHIDVILQYTIKRA